MQHTYPIAMRRFLMVPIFLILFLSGCSEQTSPVIGPRQYSIEDIDQSPQPLNPFIADTTSVTPVQEEAKQFINKSFIAAGGYVVRFIGEDKWLAIVESSEAVNSIAYQLPVHLAPEMGLVDLLTLDEALQRRRIHVVFKKGNQQKIPACVYVGSMGLLGGGNAPSTVRCNECTLTANVTSSETGGFLWLYRTNYYYCPYCAQQVIEREREVQRRREEQSRKEAQQRREEERRRKKEEQRKKEEIRITQIVEENQRAREVAKKKEEEEQKQQEQEEAAKREKKAELQAKIETRRDEEERLQEERAAQSKLRQQQRERAWKEEQQRLLEEFQQEERKQEEALAQETALRLKQLEHANATKKLQEMRRMLDLGLGEEIASLKKKIEETMENQDLLDEITHLLSTRQEITEELIMVYLDQRIANMIGELDEIKFEEEESEEAY